MHHGCQRPGNRVGNIQGFKRSVCLEYRVDPDNPEYTCTAQGNQHGQHGMPHSPKAAHQSIHHPAEEIGTTDIEHPFQSDGDHCPLRSVQLQKKTPRKIEQIAQNQPRRRHNENTLSGNDADSLIFFGTVILSHKADCRLVQRVHRHIDKALQISGCGVSRHGVRTKGVYGGLD